MNEPKRLFLDIETVPIEGRTWGKYQQDLLEVVRDWYIICVGVKWFGKPAEVFALPDFATYKKDPYSDKELVKLIFEYMNEADIIIAQNGDEFDIKKINTRLLLNGFKPPAPYKTVDTLKILRHNFAHTSNRLDDVRKALGGKGKMDTGGYKLWKGCLANDPLSWKRMKLYNKRDVIELEELYKTLLPWAKTHPNIGMFTDKIVCPKCGSGHFQSRGFAFNNTTKYRRLQCMGCGGWMRETKNIKEGKPLVSL